MAKPRSAIRNPKSTISKARWAALRLFAMDVLRHYGQGTLSAFLGPSCANEQLDHDELLLAPYTEQRAQEQIDARMRDYRPPERPYPGPALDKYARLVSSASLGAVTR